MPEMYKELHGESEYVLDVSMEGITGTRTFQQNDAAGNVAAASLPEVGTSLMVDLGGTDVANCICRRKRAVFIGGDGGTRGYEFTYSTEETTVSNSMNNRPRNLAAEDFELSVEEEVIQAYPSGRLNVFEFEGAANDDVKWAEQGIPRKLMTGTFNIPYANQELNSTQRDTFIGKIKTYGGTINAAAFMGFAAGQVRFDGASGGNFVNDEGNVRWAFNLHFSFKLLGGSLVGGTAISSDDWLYIVNEKEGVYRKVKNHDTGKYLYEKSNFATLVTP